MFKTGLREKKDKQQKNCQKEKINFPRRKIRFIDTDIRSYDFTFIPPSLKSGAQGCCGNDFKMCTCSKRRYFELKNTFKPSAGTRKHLKQTKY